MIYTLSLHDALPISDTDDQSRHDGQNQVESLKTEMHEVRDDQGRLDDRRAHQNHQHISYRQMYIAEKDFEAGKKQQPHPDRNEQLIRAREMLLKLDVCAHLLSAPEPRLG